MTPIGKKDVFSANFRIGGQVTELSLQLQVELTKITF
jgi:hypothetical protein